MILLNTRTSLAISIALCTYNGARYLREQLASISRQSRLPSELIVCDDVSSDETPTIIREFAATSEFPVRMYVNDVNLGSTANFERAICLCNGDVIVLADQDDRWREDKLAQLHDVFAQSSETAMVFSDANLFDPNGDSLGLRLWQSIGFSHDLRRRLAEGKFFEVLLKRTVVTGATMAFRTICRDRFMPIPGNWVHDAWITFVVAIAGGRIDPISEPLIDYRIHPEQQIGVPQKLRSHRQQLLFARNLSASKFAEIAGEFEVAEVRAIDLLGAGHHRLPLIAEKVRHLQQRAEIKRHRGLKAACAVNELLSGRYHKYSLGWRSFFLDVTHLLPDAFFK